MYINDVTICKIKKVVRKVLFVDEFSFYNHQLITTTDGPLQEIYIGKYL